MLNQYETVSARVFEEIDSLEVTGRYGIGVDTIDIEAATANDVAVVNVPDYCLDEVAEHTVGLVLSWIRKIPSYDRQTRAGEWDWSQSRAIHRFTGATVGVVGFGNISRNVAEKLRGFDVQLLAYDPYVEDSVISGFGAKSVSFEALLADSDVVSIHAPLVEETRGLFDRDAFERMNEHAILINTARGEIVDTTALESAIASNTIAGACFDVLPEEPPSEDNPLRRLDNVIVTPHVSWYSEESITALRTSLCENVLNVLAGEYVDSIVNPID